MQTVLITGANRGIGLALTQQCLQRGDRVIAVCRDAGSQLPATGAQVEAGVDVTDARAVEALAQRLGDTQLDRVILNAGIMSFERLGSLDEDAFQRMRHQFEVNALGPLRFVEALAKNLGEGSKIGLMTSRMGSISDNGSGGSYGYRASKAALNAIGKSLALDLAPRKIGVFLLHPGYVATDMVGGTGDVSPDHAAKQLLARLDALELDQSGSFWHANGNELPW
ncbi:MAG TPA: SDR family oxidoreductase [Myxococcaceae bacterium]|nr:SDR family oxidoreductase [Myxococcaceae bacterium]